MARTGRLSRLLERQGEDLDRLTDAEAVRILRIYDAARRELAERLAAALDRSDGTVVFTAFDIARTQALVTDAMRQLESRLGVELDAATLSSRTTAAEQLLDLITAAEPDFKMIGGSIRADVLARVSAPDGLLLHRYSIQRYGSDMVSRMQGHLVQGVAQRLTYVQMRERLVAREFSAMASMRPRAELIVRNEMSTAYNGIYTDEVGRLSARLDRPGDDDPLSLRLSEYLDLRSHPISWLLDGQTRLPEGPPFKVSVAAVRAKAAQLKKPAGGVLWKVQGGFYVGNTLPAHHWERGRVHAWRKSWADLMGD